MEVGGGWDEFEIVRIKYPGSSLLPSSLIYFSVTYVYIHVRYLTFRSSMCPLVPPSSSSSSILRDVYGP